MTSVTTRRLCIVVMCMMGGYAPPALVQSTTEVGASSCVASAELNFICGADKPEDLAHIPGTRWLIASGFANGSGLKLIDTHGKTMRFWYSGHPASIPNSQSPYRDCREAPDVKSFNVQGISLRARGAGQYTLYAANHGGRETIEVFAVDANAAEPALSWEGCVLLPEGLAANSVTATPDGTLLITVLAHPGKSYADFVNGKPTGGVYRWRSGMTAFRLLPGTELPGNNGIESSPDGQEFYVIAFGLRTVFVYSLADTSRPIRQAIAPNFMPDNLHWDNGRLILAGMVHDEPACGGPRKVIDGQADPMRCHRGYVVASMDPVTMKFSIIAYSTPNAAHNGVSSAVVIGDELWLGSYQADRIGYRSLPEMSGR